MKDENIKKVLFSTGWLICFCSVGGSVCSFQLAG